MNSESNSSVTDGRSKSNVNDNGECGSMIESHTERAVGCRQPNDAFPIYSVVFFLMKSGLAGFFFDAGINVLRATGCAASGWVVSTSESASFCDSMGSEACSVLAASVAGVSVPAGFSFFILKEGVLRGIDGDGDVVEFGWLVPFFSAFNKAIQERKV